MKPLAIDLYCGLGGWAEGFLVEARPYPGQLVLQDVLTLDGRQFRNAAAIVASPPCQKYSYMAMPWTRAKDMASDWRRMSQEGRDVGLNALFNACFRIQREASEAAGHEIPMVVENVKGAQPWVGPARAHFGSFYLWGDINSVGGSIVAGRLDFGNVLRPGKRGTGGKHNPDGTENGQGSWFKIADSKNRGSKNNGGSWFNEPTNTESGHRQNPDGRAIKGTGGSWFTPEPDGRTKQGHWRDGACVTRQFNSKEPRRKQKQAEIAMIPPPLARHIARVFYPTSASSTRTSHR
jgi:hypothetical protein